MKQSYVYGSIAVCLIASSAYADAIKAVPQHYRLFILASPGQTTALNLYESKDVCKSAAEQFLTVQHAGDRPGQQSPGIWIGAVCAPEELVQR